MSFRLEAAAVVGGCACINIGFGLWALATRPALNSDFRGPWSFAEFARHHAAQIYQAAPLQAFQHQVYPGFHSFFPDQYPPSFLLACRWLGAFSYPVAEMIWTIAGVIALAGAAAMFFKPQCRRFAILALLASPASLLNGAAGETGYFTTALLLAGFALLPARPWAAGFAFGLLTLKPQLGLLLPAVLLARADYRACSAACLTAFGLIALSCAMYPPGLWLDWLRSLPVYQAEYLAAGKALNLHTLVTPAGNLTVLGLPPCIVWSLQALASFGSFALVYLTFRHAPYRLAVAAFFAGMFLCAPHANAYDTLPLIAAMLLLEPKSPAAAIICAITYLAPLMLLTGAKDWFLYTIPETLLFVSIIYLAIGPRPRPNMAHEPVPSAEFRARPN